VPSGAATSIPKWNEMTPFRPDPRVVQEGMDGVLAIERLDRPAVGRPGRGQVPERLDRGERGGGRGGEQRARAAARALQLLRSGGAGVGGEERGGEERSCGGARAEVRVGGHAATVEASSNASLTARTRAAHGTGFAVTAA